MWLGIRSEQWSIPEISPCSTKIKKVSNKGHGDIGSIPRICHMPVWTGPFLSEG